MLHFFSLNHSPLRKSTVRNLLHSFILSLEASAQTLGKCSHIYDTIVECHYLQKEQSVWMQELVPSSSKKRLQNMKTKNINNLDMNSL